MAKVVVYSSRSCGYCHAAKSLLSQKGVDYQEVLVDANPELRRKVMRDSGQRTVPQIWVDKTHVGGFTELRAMDGSGKLDKILQATG